VQLTTFAVNYVGHPFNESITENSGMFNSVKWAACFLLVLVMELVPSLNERWGARAAAQLRGPRGRAAARQGAFCASGAARRC
jgi:hypothetical protein